MAWPGNFNRHKLQNCLEKVHGLAFLNSTAQSSFDDIRNGMDSGTIPFLPRPSGSLGNFMVRDPDLSWMVSNVVCFFQFQNFHGVTKCVNGFILASQRRVVDKQVSILSLDQVSLISMTLIYRKICFQYVILVTISCVQASEN